MFFKVVLATAIVDWAKAGWDFMVSDAIIVTELAYPQLLYLIN